MRPVVLALAVLVLAGAVAAQRDLVTASNEAVALRESTKKLNTTMVGELPIITGTMKECKADIRDQGDRMVEGMAASIANRISELLVEEREAAARGRSCDLGKLFKNAAAILSKDKDGCMGEQYRSKTLRLKAKMRRGTPQLQFKCLSQECYQCLARQDCGLDDLATQVTERKTNTRPFSAPLPEHPDYLGNHQLWFDQSGEFAQLPRVASFTKEFTFEAWVAWMPQFKERTNGASVKIFDFFAEDEERKRANEKSLAEWEERKKMINGLDAEGEKAWQAKMEQLRAKAKAELAATKAERAKHRAAMQAELNQAKQWADAPTYDPLARVEELELLQTMAGAKSTAHKIDEDITKLTRVDEPQYPPHYLDNGLEPPPDDGIPTSKPGVFKSKFHHMPFSPKGMTQQDPISRITLSPGEFRPAESKFSESKPVGIRVTLDKMEVVCEESLPQNEWAHIALVVHAKGASHHDDCCWNVGVYVNGHLKCIHNELPITSVALDRILWVVDNNFLGRDQGNTPEGSFHGYMDEVRMWNTARTRAQIRQYMDLPAPSSDKTLLAYYRFDELEDSDAVVDQSQHAKHGWLGDKDKIASNPHRVSVRKEARFGMPA